MLQVLFVVLTFLGALQEELTLCVEFGRKLLLDLELLLQEGLEVLS
jgi:hypothetical protein|tara:strand:+ start:166 stop:303 length:138 start_codon:yes stop_codon:yes gene_type:complete